MRTRQHTDWYNKGQKELYLTNTKLTHREEMSTKLVFSTISSWEKAFETDVSEMSKSQLLLTLNSLSTSNPTVVKSKHRIVKSYIQYCRKQGFPSFALDYFELTTQQVDIINDETVFNRWLKNPAEAVEYVSLFFNSSKKNDNYIGMAASFLLTYIGISQDDILNLKSSDIDKANGTIKGIKVFDECWEIIENAMNSDKILHKVNMQNPYIVLSPQDIKEGYIIKDKYHPTEFFSRTANYCTANKDSFKKLYDTNKYVTISDFEKSGLFYRQYLWETFGVGQDMSLSYAVNRHYVRWKEVFYS